MLDWKEYTSPDPDYPCRNFIEVLRDVETRHGEKTFILYRSGKQREFTKWSYSFFAAECRRIARGLLKNGLARGDRVALWAENRPEWMAVWIGAAVAGCVIVPIDYLIADNECKNILSITKPKAFFYSKRKEEFAASLDIKADLRICIDGETRDDGGSAAGEPYRQFGAGADDVQLPAVEDITERDPVSIVFTSGTTGFAKGVTLAHKGIIANVSAAILAIQPGPADTFINVLPLHHTYPTTCSFLAPLIKGCGTIIVEKLVGKVVIDDIRDAPGILLITVPLLCDKVKDALEAGLKKLPLPAKLVIKLLRSIALSRARNHSDVEFGRKALAFVRKKAGLGSVRHIIAGGGALNPKTADFFESLGFNIFHGYGMSENSPLISTGTPGFKNNDAVGLPVKYTDIRIEDSDEYGIGEILVRSPSLMLGYYENPEATKEVIIDGWLHTGDLGYQDEKGFIYISGRKKNLIVSAGGKNVYPEEIERCFDGSRVIGELLVLGRKTKNGEQIFAVTVPNRETLAADYPGKISKEGNLSEEALALVNELIKTEIEKVNRTLVTYKKICGFILRHEEFEKNAQKKIRRFLYKDYEKDDSGEDSSVITMLSEIIKKTTENIKKTTESVTENIKKTTESVTENIKKTTESVTENIKKTTESVTENIKKTTETITDKLKK